MPLYCCGSVCATWEQAGNPTSADSPVSIPPPSLERIICDCFSRRSAPAEGELSRVLLSLAHENHESLDDTKFYVLESWFCLGLVSIQVVFGKHLPKWVTVSTWRDVGGGGLVLSSEIDPRDPLSGMLINVLFFSC